MKPENKQRFSIRKYAIGAASVLIGFAFQAQGVAADGVVPVTTEDRPTVQTTGESAPQTSEEKLETAPSTENVAPTAPVATTTTEAPKVEVAPAPTVEEPVATEVAPAKPVVTEEAKKIESEKEENKEAAQVEAPSAKEYKLPETGSQSSEWLIATGLMAALTAYGLSKKED